MAKYQKQDEKILRTGENDVDKYTLTSNNPNLNSRQ